MAVVSLSAEAVYASKPNIQRPGQQADANTAETEAAARMQDEYANLPINAGQSANGTTTNPLVSTDAADLAIVSNAQSATDEPKPSIPWRGN
jgi:hypothetical protein